MLIDAVRQFIKTELAPHEQAIEDNGFLDPAIAADIHAKSKEMGFYAMNMPEKFGGAGLSAVDTMLVEEQFGHTTDILIRRAFGNIYEALLACEFRRGMTYRVRRFMVLFRQKTVIWSSLHRLMMRGNGWL